MSTPGPKPIRAIYTEPDLEQFKKSQSFNDLVQFVRVCGRAVEGKKNSDAGEPSPVLAMLNEFLENLKQWIDEIPPIQQPMRFGNKAFRDFHQRLVERTPTFVESLLATSSTDIQTYNAELSSYMCDSFGNQLRIDYGTGHETNFAIFAFCLFKLHLLTEEDLSCFVLRSFTSYMQVMRKLQSVYYLEPAGSHGVWGLDDYQCLNYVWGASQLVHHPGINPADVRDEQLVKSEASEYLYLEGIQTIQRVKHTAPFHETSPMLHSISELGDWKAVRNGMHKLYLGEVLNKLPVVQHIVFGRLLPATWTPAPIAIPPTNHHGGHHQSAAGHHQSASAGGVQVPHVPALPAAAMEATRAPWAQK